MCEVKLKAGRGLDHMAQDLREVAEASVLWMMAPLSEQRNSGRLRGGTSCVYSCMLLV